MVTGALLSAQWIYLLDPLVLMFRGVTAGVYPALNAVLPIERAAPALSMSHYGVAFAPVALFLGAIGLTAITPRFYCRYLCPLGAFYGLLSRAPLIRRRVTGCDGCSSANTDKQCVTGCRMGAVGSNPHLTQNHECIRCMTGRSFCPQEAIHFDPRPPAVVERKDLPLDLGRRRLLLAGGTGLALAPLAGLSAYQRDRDRNVIRPPMVTDEETFTDQCIRCAMCVQACPTQTLQLTHLEAGLAGFWTPAITPSVGGCESGCNACSVACPTDAIPVFGKAEGEKWAVKMGTAVLEKNRCISHTEDLPCRKCVDVCPTKAFLVEPATDQTPERPIGVDYVRCVGCGLCENECGKIVFGNPALLTFSHGRGQPTVLRERPTETHDAPIAES
jgi:ferredoxin